MGGTSSSTQNSQQQSQLTPWAPAAGQIQGVLGNLDPSINNLNGGPAVTNALSALQGIANGPNTLGAPAVGAAGSQLAGGANYGAATNALNSSYGSATSALSPYASGGAYNSPALAQMRSTNAQDVSNQVNPMFSAAGRLGSPDNYQALARGITQGETPLLQGAANNQIQAGGMLGNLGASTAGGLNAADVANAGIQSQGINNASTAFGTQALGPQAALNAGLLQNQLPIQNAGALTGILGPLAAQFGQQNASGSQTGTQTMSPMQQALMATQMFSNIFGGGGGGSAGNASKLIFG